MYTHTYKLGNHQQHPAVLILNEEYRVSFSLYLEHCALVQYLSWTPKPAIVLQHQKQVVLIRQKLVTADTQNDDDDDEFVF